jgi:hypothetical protein
VIASLVAIFVLANSTGVDGGVPGPPPPPIALEAQVRDAFLASRRGDPRGLDAVEKLGAVAVRAVGRYVDDPDEDVRREAVMLLAAIRTPNALPFIARALLDPATGVRERAATHLYDDFAPRLIAAEPRVGVALRTSVQRSISVAAPILLLAYFPGEETLDTLVRIRVRDADNLVRLHWPDPDVPVELVSYVAGAHLGDPDAVASLSAWVGRASLDELRFLLLVLREIEAPAVLQRLTRAFDDQRAVPEESPERGPQRRLCDLAVESFRGRLRLHPTFAKRYFERYRRREVAEAKRLVLAALAER